MATRIKLRRDTASNWTTTNPILAIGEPGWETDTRKIKLGDGTTAWRDLPYSITGDLQITGTEIVSKTALTLRSGTDSFTDFLSVFNGSGEVDTYTDSVAYDADGNMFVSRFYHDYGGIGLAKLSPTGERLWDTWYGNSTPDGWGMIVDGNGDAFLLGQRSNAIVLIKTYGSSGDIAWQKTIVDNANQNDLAGCIDYDSNNNIVVAGYYYNGNDRDFLVAKVNGSTGALMWTRVIADSVSSDETAWGLAVDYNNNICFVGNSFGPRPDYLNMVKLDSDGVMVWQKTLYDPNSPFSDEYDMSAADIGVDIAGNFYVTTTWMTDYDGYSLTAILVSKLDADGNMKWTRQLGPSGYDTVAGSVTCDPSGNIYVSAQFFQPETDSSNTTYHYDRVSYFLVKLSPSGRVIWQRFLNHRQYFVFLQSEPGKDPDWSTGGQLVAANSEYVAIGGTISLQTPYDFNQNWAYQAFAAQIPQDGTEFNVDGWEFVDSKQPVSFISVPVGTASLDIQNVSFSIGNASVASFTNLDTYQVSSFVQTPTHTATFDTGTLSIPRDTIGYVVTGGNFDGTEGGNTQGNTWFQGVARDNAGNSYLAAGWQPGPPIPGITKINSTGEIEWQSVLSQVIYDVPAAIAVDPTTQEPVFVSLDGNEGFNVTRYDPTDGSVKSTTHITKHSENENWYQPYSVAIDGNGRPVVVGENNYGHVEYANVTNGAAGLAGSTSGGVLVISKTVFTAPIYPTGYDNWYVSSETAFSNTYITHVNEFDNCATTTNSSAGGGATFKVTINPNTNLYSVVLGNSAGASYVTGDLVYVAGDLLLGDVTVNKLTITVGDVDGSGGIINWSNVAGTAQSSVVKLAVDPSIDFTVARDYKVSEFTNGDGFVWTPDWGLSVGGRDTNNDWLNAVSIDGNNNILVGGYYRSSGLTTGVGGNYDKTGLVAKLDDAGATQWQVIIDGTEGRQEVRQVKADPNDDVLVWSTAYEGTSYLTKLSGSDGSMMWQVEMYGDNWWLSQPDAALDVDANGNAYVGGRYYDDNLCYNSNFLITKVDPEGHLLYTRDFGSVWNVEEGYNYNGLNTLSVMDDRLSICFHSYSPGDGAYQATMADLPTDGSGSGTWGIWNYRELEYSFDLYTDRSTTPVTATFQTHEFYIDNYNPVPVAFYGDRQSQVTEIKATTGGTIALNKIVFEDGSEQTTSGMDIPQVPADKTNFSSYYPDLSDRGKHILKYNGYIYIPRDQDMPFPIGSLLTIVTDNNNIYLYADYSGTTRIRGVGSDSNSSSYRIYPYSMVTLLKVHKDVWMLSGAGGFEAH